MNIPMDGTAAHVVMAWKNGGKKTICGGLRVQDKMNPVQQHAEKCSGATNTL